MSDKKQQKKKKKKDRYDVMMLPSDGGKVRQFKFSMNAFIRGIVTLVVVIALLVCYSVYCTQAMQGVHLSIGSTGEKLQKVTDENAALAAENAELSEAVNALNTVIADMEKEAQVAQVTKSEQSIPTGFPLDGSASLMSEQDAAAVGEATPAPGDDKRVVFTATVGTAVMAAGTGVVSEVSDEGTYGHVIKIDHQNGYETIYYTSANVRVMQGDEVEKGDVICIMTMDSELLAYQIMQDGQYIDPMSLMEIAG
ncbi:MAG TPA: M23 family metallopeptidase [Lachnospiraceae bacterium]|nr:M23 family metallopeptidase [Lachnospiraceae bacterium]